LDNLLLPTKYNKKVRPEIGGPATKVMVNMYIKSIGPVSESDGSYTMDVYFRQQWYDKRLSFYLPGLEELTMSWLFLEKIWKPDTFFMNGKASHLHRITSPNKFLRLRQDGFMTYSMRLTLTASCPMYLHKFPMDSQRCPLVIGSYGYSKRDILYEWSGGGVGLEPGVELAQYDLVNISTKNKQIVVRENEEFSMVQGTLILRRNLGYFILQMYVPLSLIVSCSWVSFWIDPKAVPARVQLGVTTVLSITTIGFGGRAALPKVSYPTALDWFIIICFAFVFGAIVEYAYINFIDKITADIKKLLEERKKNKEIEEEKKDLKQSSGNLTNQLSSQEAITKSSLLEMSSPSTSRKPGVPRIQLTYESDEFEDIDADEDVVRKKKKTKHRSTLRKRRTASLPVLNRQSSFSSEDSEKLGKIYIHDKHEALTIFSKILNLEYPNSEATDSDKMASVVGIRRDGSFRKTLRIPKKLFQRIKILPTEKEIEEQIEPPELFTKLDIASRVVFPVAYFLVITMYALYYMYYLTDMWDTGEL